MFPGREHTRTPQEPQSRTGYTQSSNLAGTRRRNHRKSSEMTQRVSPEDVERVAELAHLELGAEETPRMVHDLNEILDYVAELDELDTSGVAPLAQVSELEGAGGASSLRQDELVPSLPRTAVMPQSPETDGAFFKVPKVIER
jgi:aspartyl-tRNA(Asn)/glutamyl-tRNA(Gln) amidotransferase subunit C